MGGGATWRGWRAGAEPRRQEQQPLAVASLAAAEAAEAGRQVRGRGGVRCRIGRLSWPSVFWPSVFWPSVFWPSVFWPSVFWPSVFWPSPLAGRGLTRRVRGTEGLKASGQVLGVAGQASGFPQPSGRHQATQTARATAETTGAGQPSRQPATRPRVPRPRTTRPRTTGTRTASLGVTRPGSGASGTAGRSPRTPALGLLFRPLLALGRLGRAPHARDRRHTGDPAPAHHLPHHLLAFGEPHDQVVHLADGGARAASRSGPAGSRSRSWGCAARPGSSS